MPVQAGLLVSEIGGDQLNELALQKLGTLLTGNEYNIKVSKSMLARDIKEKTCYVCPSQTTASSVNDVMYNLPGPNNQKLKVNDSFRTTIPETLFLPQSIEEFKDHISV